MNYFVTWPGPRSATGRGGKAQPNRPDLGNPFGGTRPACPRAPSQGVTSASVRIRSPSVQDRPSASRNTRASVSSRRGSVCNVTPGAARHARHLVEREHQQLAVACRRRPGGRRRPATHSAARSPGLGRFSTCLPVRFSATSVVGLHHEAAAGVRCDQVARALAQHEQRDHVVLAGHLRQQPHRLPVAAPARQLAGAQRVGAAVGGEQAQPVGGLAGQQPGAARRLP